MLDIKKEGYVNVNFKTDNNIDYLFYLTFNNRADILNKSNSSLKFNNIYQYYYDIKKHKKNEFKGSGIMFFEIIMSLSTEFNKIMGIKFGTEKWVKIYEENVNNILENNLKEFVSFSSFFHKFDKSGFRLHNHTLIYPYLKTNQKDKLTGEIINKLVSKIDYKIIDNIKTDYKQFAFDMFSKIPKKELLKIEEIIDKEKEIKQTINNEKIIQLVKEKYPKHNDKLFNEFKELGLEEIKKICEKKKYIELSNFLDEIEIKPFTMFKDNCILNTIKKEEKSERYKIFNSILQTSSTSEKIEIISKHIYYLKNNKKDIKDNQILLLLELLEDLIQISSNENYNNNIKKIKQLYYDLYFLSNKTGELKSIVMDFIENNIHIKKIEELHNIFKENNKEIHNKELPKIII